MERTRIAAILLAAVMIIAVSAGCGAGEPASQADSSGSSQTAVSDSGFPSLSEFTAKTLDGKEYTQEDFAKADLTVLHIWATWCGPCMQEMPHLAEFAKTLPDNVSLITYCLDAAEDPEYAGQILDQVGFDGTTLVSGDGDLNRLNGQVQYIPTTIFVDGGGNVVGEAIIGAAGEVESVYTESINNALTLIGKQGIS